MWCRKRNLDECVIDTSSTSKQCQGCKNIAKKCTSCPQWSTDSAVKQEELASLIIQQWVTEVLEMQAEGTPKSEIPVRPEVVPVDWRRAVNRVLKLSNGGRPKITAKNFETVGTKTSLPKNLKGAAKGTRASARLTRPRASEVPQSSSKRK